MLVLNGALAVFNGLLIASCKALCCATGGICCGAVCRSPDEEGVCCGDEWYTEPGVCCQNEWINEDGTIPGREGEWKCCEDSNGDITVPQVTPAEAECGQLFLRCCEQGECRPDVGDCTGEVLPGSCITFGCPKPCCTEDSSGAVLCERIDEATCDGIVDEDEDTCENACKGTCCIDDEPVADSPMTQAACDAIGGFWGGVGSTECCPVETCREPFDSNCCERVISSAARLTFKGPRKKRCPELEPCGVQVTVKVTTGSPVYVHGGLFGSPYEACTVITSFYLCNDEFVVTPAPCSGTLNNLDIEVCWDESDGEEDVEVLRFNCCQDITYLLGNCDCECSTTLLYEGPECTSNAVMLLGGDSAIEASGTGPLVLTSPIAHTKTCNRTLTLKGSNAGDNSIAAMPDPFSAELAVTKDGPGLWVFTVVSSYSGQTTIKNGTLVAAVGAVNTGNGVFGSSNSPTPIIGDTSTGAAGVAALLLRADVAINRDLIVAASSGTQVARLGGAHTSGVSVFAVNREIRLGADRDIELVSKASGLVRFRNFWKDAGGGTNVENNFTVGTAGFSGVVRLESDLSTSGSVLVVSGRLEINEDGSLSALDGLTCDPDTELRIIVGSGADRIDPLTEVVLRGSMLELGGTSQRIEILTLASAAIIQDAEGGGLLRLDGSVDVIQAGNEILCDVELVSTTTFSGSGSLVIVGDISGSGIVKDGSGTLTLTGSNTYTGTTTVQAGVLQIGNGGTAGTLGSGSVVNDAIVVFNRSDNLTVSNVISGSGSVVKLGGGELTLSGANTYSGGTTVSAGILIGTTGSLQGDIVVAAATALIFDDSSGGTYAGIISGNGAVEKRDAGTVIFTGANTYSGGTTVSAGILVGTTTSLQGNVANSSALVFDDASGGTYAGTISGTGTVEKTGAGTVVFTGSNSYTGATTIAAGTLQVGNGGAAGTLGTGAVSNNSALAFNRNNAITVASAISGTGSLAQDGSGTLTLTGTLSYSGTTSIAAGTLVVTTLVSGPPNVSLSTFTPTALVVQFTATPSSGETYRLLPGATAQAYASVTLNGAGGATGTYNSANSTLTID
jgi:autotransporter-associated beta strand protein